MTAPGDPLPNPELAWEGRDDVRQVDRDEVEQRLGRRVERIEVLSGGLANLNVLVDGASVLRIYRREPQTLRKEVALLGRTWRQLRVPAVLGRGEDFLLLEHVRHRPLQGMTRHGAAVGRALAEIHAVAHASSGLLDGDLEVTAPFRDFVTAVRDHAATEIAAPLPADLGARVLAVLDQQTSALRAVVGPPVLLHGDFKPSNLHWTDAGELLVLDWEFAYAGSALMDVGQLMRWSCPTEFTRAFADAYRADGGVLPEDWIQWGAVLDLVNLVGLLRRAPPGSRRASDTMGRIAETLVTCA